MLLGLQTYSSAASAAANLKRTMRLCTDQVATMRQEALNLAGDSARVWLFGSRVHDEARGGDVDLLIEMDGLGAAAVLVSVAPVFDLLQGAALARTFGDQGSQGKV